MQQENTYHGTDDLGNERVGVGESSLGVIERPHHRNGNDRICGNGANKPNYEGQYVSRRQ